ncbi:MAG: peptide chain release factor N(5)-glutamine methyltransferase [Bacteroidota bacterium]
MLTQKSASARIWYARVYDLLVPWLKDPCECKAISRRLLSYYLGYDLNKHVLEEVLTADDATLQALNEALGRLQADEPIQYILGEAPFLAHTLQVSPSVLIPRPETEEMVNAILQENDLRGARVLDICTGSGCIALAIQKAYPTSVVHALDASKKALALAEKNGIALGANITWHHLDFLKEEVPSGAWNLLVSNPPYIPVSEKKGMGKRVVEHEPMEALFVPDDKKCLFYEKIASLAKTHLTKKGHVYVEFHAPLAREVEAVFLQHSFNVRIYRDLQGQERWLAANS